MHLSDFHYDLPEELIARYPLANRSGSRLLCLDKKTGEMAHRQFVDIVSLLSPNDLLVCNNTRVIAARLLGQKETGGRIEVLVERILDEKRILAQVRVSKSPKPQSFLIFPTAVRFEVLKRCGDLYELYCHATKPVLEIIEIIGHVPIPPYFQRSAEESDKERYQTIYADPKGSVAAPTAGLHFDAELFSKLQQKNIQIAYLTLHVGAGTFASVRVNDITQHQMHAEHVEVSSMLCQQIANTKARGGKVIAVGTTTARSLETASLSGDLQAFSGDTDIFIYPGFQFKCIDGLITNFHLPSSTLLMLVSAFAGYEHTMHAYKIAVEQRYRFFSYGDAMLVLSE